MEGDEEARDTDQKTLRKKGSDLPPKTETGIIALGLRQQEDVVPDNRNITGNLGTTSAGEAAGPRQRGLHQAQR